jgi:Ca2+-binding EF-hand superfamily protein
MNVSGIGGLAGYQAASAMGMSRPPGTPPTDEQMKAKISDFLTSLDTDGNGSVSLAESGVSQDSFSQVDANGDGQITAEELLGFLKANRPSPPPFSSPESGGASHSRSAGEAATSGNGSANVADSGLSDSDFSVMDTNKDGVVSLEELVAYLQANPTAASQQGTETSDTSGTGAQMFTRQQAIQAYSGQKNELVTNLFEYMKNGSQNNGLDVTV